jgi:ATP-dependent Clp protease ATP-binding subunit ClpA
MIGAGAVSGGTMDAANIAEAGAGLGQVCAASARPPSGVSKALRARPRPGAPLPEDRGGEPSVGRDGAHPGRACARSYEEFHGITYPTGALEAAVKLASGHLHDRKLPDKAIDVMDEAGARRACAENESRHRGRRRHGARRQQDGVSIPREDRRAFDKSASSKNLERSCAAWCSGKTKPSPAGGHQTLTRGPSAAREAHRLLPVHRSNGRGQDRARQAARQGARHRVLALRHERVPERHTVSRLIGAPPGYVGFDRGGLLTDQVRQDAPRGARARRDREGAPDFSICCCR